MKALLVTADKSSLADLATALEKNGIKTSWARNGSLALSQARETGPDLMVSGENLEDMTGLELIQRVLRVNALINTAVVSRLPAQEFHEQSEGLGILTALPPDPGRAEAKDLLARLREALGLT